MGSTSDWETMEHASNILAGLKVDRKSTRLNSSHGYISYAVFCLKKKKKKQSGFRERSQRNTKHTTPHILAITHLLSTRVCHRSRSMSLADSSTSRVSDQCGAAH